MKLLKPLSVPWMVAPSLPKLTLISEEGGVQLVKFCGYFGYEESAATSNSSIIVDDSPLIVNPIESSARYQLICLKFDLVGWIRRSPQYSDREVIQETEYDWSCVSGFCRSAESVESWSARFNQEWIDTRICPDPCIYAIENSDWDVGPDKARFKLQHFLILGETGFIEIMARGCTWVSEGNITR